MLCWSWAELLVKGHIADGSRTKTTGICRVSLLRSFSGSFTGKSHRNEQAQSLEKNKPDQQVVNTFLLQNIFSIFTSIKQTRNTDGQGRAHSTRKNADKRIIRTV